MGPISFDGHRDRRGPGVLGRVGQCFGDDVVGADLNLDRAAVRRRPVGAEPELASGRLPRAPLSRGRPRSESPDECRATDRAVPQVRRVPARWHGRDASEAHQGPSTPPPARYEAPALARPAAAGRRLRADRVRSGGGFDRRRQRHARGTPQARHTALRSVVERDRELACDQLDGVEALGGEKLPA